MSEQGTGPRRWYLQTQFHKHRLQRYSTRVQGVVMSILKTVQIFIVMNPGSITRDIIEGLTQFSQDRLQLAVCRLCGSELATRKCDGRQLHYYAESSADCHFEVSEPTSKVSVLMETTKDLESKSLLHRAATIYMETFSSSVAESERAAILVGRQRRLDLAKPAVITEDGRYLVGRFSGGR